MKFLFIIKNVRTYALLGYMFERAVGNEKWESFHLSWREPNGTGQFSIEFLPKALVLAPAFL